MSQAFACSSIFITLGAISVQEMHYCGVEDSTCEPEVEVMDMPAKGCSATSYVPVTVRARTHHQQEAKRMYQSCTYPIVVLPKERSFGSFFGFYAQLGSTVSEQQLVLGCSGS